jgi:hypothetical protein
MLIVTVECRAVRSGGHRSSRSIMRRSSFEPHQDSGVSRHHEEMRVATVHGGAGTTPKKPSLFHSFCRIKMSSGAQIFLTFQAATPACAAGAASQVASHMRAPPPLRGRLGGSPSSPVAVCSVR